MATWTFKPPNRLSIPYEDSRVLSIFTRMTYTRGSCVLRLPSATWEEWEGTVPDTRSPSNIDYFGATGFSDPTGDGAATYLVPTRMYLGGHTYFIDDDLKAELEAAVTAQEPGGYGAYITAGGSGRVGDEIILSGHTSDHPRESV